MLDKLWKIALQRRSVREFSSIEIDLTIVDKCIEIAGTAPSGANKQPWHFCVVTNNEIKKKIRMESEKIEYELYHEKISDEWRKDLEKFETNENKSFLEDAPVLIIVMKEITGPNKEKNYYVNESVGLATGMLLLALNTANIQTLTYTPSPMQFLSKILNRPENERPYMVITCGYKKEGYMPTDVSKKQLKNIRSIY